MIFSEYMAIRETNIKKMNNPDQEFDNMQSRNGDHVQGAKAMQDFDAFYIDCKQLITYLNHSYIF